MTTPPLGSSHTILAPLLGPELAERVDVGLVAASRWWRNARAKKGVFMTVWAITLLALLTGLVAVWRSDRPEILAGASESAVDIAPGVRMPLLSNGIGDQLLWLRKGGRGIDTAVLYGEDRQHEVRDAIRASGVPREQIYSSLQRFSAALRTAVMASANGSSAAWQTTYTHKSSTRSSTRASRRSTFSRCRCRAHAGGTRSQRGVRSSPHTRAASHAPSA